MNGSVFLDANVVLYSFSITEPDKASVARGLLNKKPWISPQVVFESLNVMLKKWRVERFAAVYTIKQLLPKCSLCPETDAVVLDALFLFEQYGLQSYDSKIVAAALSAGCATLYSEDMQDGLVIEGRLTIVNPFKS